MNLNIKKYFNRTTSVENICNATCENKLSDDLDISSIFDTIRLIISNNTLNDNYDIICNKKLWTLMLNKKKIIYEFILILQYNYNDFVNLIKIIDIKLHIINDIIELLLLTNYNNSKLDDFFYDLWIIN